MMNQKIYRVIYKTRSEVAVLPYVKTEASRIIDVIKIDIDEWKSDSKKIPDSIVNHLFFVERT